jgi:hypothetical protein
MINKGAAKTIAGSKVSHQMDNIRKLRLRPTLNDTLNTQNKVTEESGS